MPARIALFLSICVTFLTSCGPKTQPDETKEVTDEQIRSHAQALADSFIIVDGHIDLPEVLQEKKFKAGVDSPDTIVSTGKGEFDYVRAKKGGLDAPFMSIYIPVEYQKKKDNGKSLADSLINTVTWITQALPDKFALANSPAEIEANTKAGKISLPMGMENGAPIGNDLKNLKYFYDRGIRYITLSHNDDNQICGASRDLDNDKFGLTSYGRQVVAEMNRLGIIVDISHVDDSTFYQVVKLTKAPVMASHSSCRALSPTTMRDMTDDMLKKLGENDGVIMINFFTMFLDSTAVRYSNELSSLLKSKNLKESDSLCFGAIVENTFSLLK